MVNKIQQTETEYVMVISQAMADRYEVKAGDVFWGAKIVVANPFDSEVQNGSPQ